MEKRLDRALSHWTFKEAYIKARGLGLALPLDKVSFLFNSEEDIRLEIDPAIRDLPKNWRFFPADHASHRIAAVLERAIRQSLKCLRLVQRLHHQCVSADAGSSGLLGVDRCG